MRPAWCKSAKAACHCTLLLQAVMVALRPSVQSFEWFESLLYPSFSFAPEVLTNQIRTSIAFHCAESSAHHCTIQIRLLLILSMLTRIWRASCTWHTVWVPLAKHEADRVIQSWIAVTGMVGWDELAGSPSIALLPQSSPIKHSNRSLGWMCSSQRDCLISNWVRLFAKNSSEGATLKTAELGSTLQCGIA